MTKYIIVSGYWDPLHVGHLEYMDLADKAGDKLVIIVNNNKQAILKKGKPFMDEKERVTIVKYLKFDAIVYLSIDEDRSVCKTIEKVYNDLHQEGNEFIFANGGDRSNGEIPEAKFCNEVGIKIQDGFGEKIQSSSTLIAGTSDEK